MPDWRAVARSIAEKAGIPPDLFERQIGQESGFDPSARSRAGAIGIAQIVPEYHPNVDPTDPVAALTYAAKWMRELHGQYGNWRDALVAYNGGGRAVQQWHAGRPFDESVAYVTAILGPGNAEAAELDQPAPQPGRSTPVASPAQDTFDRVVAAKGNPVSVLDVTPAKKLTEEDDGTKVFRYVFADGTRLETVNKPGGDFDVKGGTALGSTAKTDKPKRTLVGGNSPTERFIVWDNGYGTTTREPNPNYAPPTTRTSAKPNNKQVVTRDGKSYVYDPDTSTFTPATGLPDEKPKRTTHTVGKRIYTVDEDGHVVGSADLRSANDVQAEGLALEGAQLGNQKTQLEVEKDRKALMPQAQQVIAGHLETIKYVQGMLERGEIDQAKADAYVAASKAQAEAALQGTTPWAIKQAEDDAKQKREQLGTELLKQRISSESSLGSSVVSSALGLAAKAMLRPGQTSLGVDPFAAAAGYSAQINQNAQADPMVAALLASVRTPAAGPAIPPGTPAFPPANPMPVPISGATGPSMPGAVR